MLCLYEDPWAEVRLRWTGAGFLRDVAQWLSRTAVGELHGVDQPLEPFLLGGLDVVVVSDALLAGNPRPGGYVATYVTERQDKPSTLKLEAFNGQQRHEGIRVYVVVVEGQPTLHGAMHDSPRNLMDLVGLLAHAEIDLLTALIKELKRLYEGECIPEDDDGLIVLVKLPLQRQSHGRIERVQYCAFGMRPIRDAAIATGRFAASGHRDRLVWLLESQFDPKKARALPVHVLRTELALNRAAAKWFSGIDPSLDDPKIVLVGAGALGSQFQSHLSRMGWGRWTLVDDDILSSHNIVRHSLGEFAIGELKAPALERMSHIATPHNPVEHAFAEDVLAVESNEEMLSTFRDADLILDVSTSIAVARYLGRTLNVPARRATLFLSPNGRDAVMLMEDAERAWSLDALEAQYYRAVLTDARLNVHIRREGYVRHSDGCRDVTARIGQDDVALASALLARQVRNADDEALAAIWQQEPDGAVRRVEVPLYEVIRRKCGDWVILLDGGLLNRVESLRSGRLPRETGGVLIGYFDVPYRHVYLVDALPAPVDSEEHRDSFIRGYASLPEELREIESRTGGQVGYVGEWHSHPDCAGVAMSCDDEELLLTIANEVRADGWPGVMMIVGEDRALAFLHPRRVETLRLGVALSGGGVRAAVFHCGVLQRLALDGLLERTTFLSTVSGGSLVVGLILCRNGHRWPNSDEFLDTILPQIEECLTTSTLQWSYTWRSFALPWRLAQGRARILAKQLEAQWGIAGSLQKLPATPRWIINATCYETGKNWRFSKPRMGDYVTHYVRDPEVPIADSIAASAAVPGLIGPLVVRPSRFAWHRYRGAELVPTSTSAKRYELWDGGVYDNLGVEPLFKPSGGFRTGFDMLVVSDASAPLALEQRTLGRIVKPGYRIVRLVDIATDQIRSIRARAVVAGFAHAPDTGVYLRMGNTVDQIYSAVKRTAPTDRPLS